MDKLDFRGSGLAFEDLVIVERGGIVFGTSVVIDENGNGVRDDGDELITTLLGTDRSLVSETDFLFDGGDLLL